MLAMAMSIERTAKREAEFLRAAARILADTVAKSKLVAVEQAVFEAADKAGLKRRSVVVLVALAKLYEGEHDRPAARMLKLGQIRAAGNDWRGVAYNALADVRQIELIAAGQALPGSSALLTGDLDLVKIWCGLRPTARPVVSDPVGFEFHPVQALFPRLLVDPEQLLARLAE